MFLKIFKWLISAICYRLCGFWNTKSYDSKWALRICVTVKSLSGKINYAWIVILILLGYTTVSDMYRIEAPLRKSPYDSKKGSSRYDLHSSITRNHFYHQTEKAVLYRVYIYLIRFYKSLHISESVWRHVWYPYQRGNIQC